MSYFAEIIQMLTNNANTEVQVTLQMLRPEEWRRLVSLYSMDAAMFGYNNDIDQLGRALQEKWRTSTPKITV